MSKKKFTEDPKRGVPGYIVTFSDMITLLLTFFVMLLSMAETQVEKHKFEVGMYSFRRAIADFGMSGLLMNRSNSSNQEHPKVYYRVDDGQDEPEDRSIDAKTEMLRRVLMDIEQMMKISPSHILGAQKTVFPTHIRFSDGGWELNNPAQTTLQKLTENLKITFSRQKPSIYVLGLAADAPGSQQMAISARRAEAVADFIRQTLGQDTAWPIYCWGAGAGGDWVGHSGLVTRDTHILITVLTESQ
jgi:flagellar motor protein MotB